MASMILLLFTALIMRIMRTNKTEINIWALLRHSMALEAGRFFTSRISIQKEVVRAVSAESALEKAAAMIPIQKNKSTVFPRY